MNQTKEIMQYLIILVISVNSTINNEINNINISNDIIYPEGKELCKYEIKVYKIKLYDCKNGHIIENIELNQFKQK